MLFLPFVFCLLHELLYRFLQIFDRLLVVALHRVNDARFDVVFKDQLAGLVQSCYYRGQLYQDLTAVTAVFNHPFDGLQMSRRFREPVDDLLGMRMFVIMTMPMRVSMSVFMIVLMRMPVIVIMFMLVQ